MALGIDNSEHARRPIGFSVIGVFLLMFSFFVTYDITQGQPESAPVAAAYEYTVSQSIDTNVDYFKSSFFEKGPGTNTAYVADLTDIIGATFHYNFHGSESIKLSYAYEVTASVRGNYALQTDPQKIPSVWNKNYQLVAPTREAISGHDITLSPEVKIPFADYKKQIDQFKTALSLPLNSEVVVTCTIEVKGTVGDTSFQDKRVATITAPLDQVVYTLGIKYDKQDKKQVVAQATKDSQQLYQRSKIFVAIGLAAAGLAAIGYGLRRQIFKSPYQRELERIYRYHDGIIIRAKQPAELAGKHTVPVMSFDDLLNLEEELKTPIVAAPAGGESTQFSIIHNDVIYMYILGKPLIEELPSAALDTDDEVAKLWRHRKKPKK